MHARQLGNVVAVDRAEIGEAHLLKQHVRQQKALDSVFTALHVTRQPAADRSGIEQARQAAFERQIALTGAHIGQRPAQRTDAFRNGHIVVIQNHDERRFAFAGVVERFERHAAGERAVADERDRRTRFVFQLFGARHAERSRNGGAGMSGIERVAPALRSFGKAADAVCLPQRIKAGVASGYQLMRIRLMPHVEHQPVLRQVEHAVHGDDELHCAEARREVSAVFLHNVDHPHTQLARQRIQSTVGQLQKILYAVDASQQRIFLFHVDFNSASVYHSG